MRIYNYIDRERERYIYIYIYIYMYVERERDVYIYIYIYVDRDAAALREAAEDHPRRGRRSAHGHGLLLGQVEELLAARLHLLHALHLLEARLPEGDVPGGVSGGLLGVLFRGAARHLVPLRAKVHGDL